MKSPILYSILLSFLALAGSIVSILAQEKLFALFFAGIVFIAIFCLVYFFSIRAKKMAAALPASHDTTSSFVFIPSFFRKLVSSRYSRYLLRRILGLVLLVAILITPLAILENSRYNPRYDFSTDGFYSLSERSKKAAMLVTSPLNIQLFDLKNQSLELQAILKAYEKQNPLLTFEFVDLLRNLEAARAIGASETTLVFKKLATSTPSRKLYKKDLLPLSAGPGRKADSALLTSYQGAINRVLIGMFSKQKLPKLFVFSYPSAHVLLKQSSDKGGQLFYEGASRLGLEVLALEKLETESSQDFLKRLAGSISPNDLLMLWHAGLIDSKESCESFFKPGQALALRHFNAGGSLLILQPPPYAPYGNLASNTSAQVAGQAPSSSSKICMPFFSKLFAALSLKNHSGIVVDAQNFHPLLAQGLQQNSALPANYPLTRYGAHKLVQPFKAYGVYPFLVSPGSFSKLAAPLKQQVTADARRQARRQKPTLLSFSPLLESSPYSWLEKNYSAEVKAHARPVFQNNVDEQGSQILALAAQYQLPQSKAATRLSNKKLPSNVVPASPKPSRLVLIAEGRFALNALLPQAVNNDFLMNALLWVSGQSSLITSDYRRRDIRLFQSSSKETLNFFLLAMLALPLSFLLLGFIILRRRRYAQA